MKSFLLKWKVFCMVLPICAFNAYSCDKSDPFIVTPEVVFEPFVPDTTEIKVKPSDDTDVPVDKPGDDNHVRFSQYAELDFKHQSAAVYGDYAFFVKLSRSSICLYDLKQKAKVYTANLRAAGNTNIYHCNQTSFGLEKYEPTDLFPLLYISQRPRSDSRCFVEVFRILPTLSEDQTSILSFKVELVQEIFFPPMKESNSLGNVNCVIDINQGRMYSYSRNNKTTDENYLQCKISRFRIPEITNKQVVLNDSDIESSFMIYVSAENMQGACIVDNLLYIAQGVPFAKSVFLNVVDLQQRKLVKRYDLLGSGFNWEPEGCFFYDGSVMLSHTDAICRIEE